MRPDSSIYYACCRGATSQMVGGDFAVAANYRWWCKTYNVKLFLSPTFSPITCEIYPHVWDDNKVEPFSIIYCCLFQLCRVDVRHLYVRVFWFWFVCVRKPNIYYPDRLHQHCNVVCATFCDSIYIVTTQTTHKRLSLRFYLAKESRNLTVHS